MQEYQKVRIWRTAIISFTVCVVLFSGEPDLMDALIYVITSGHYDPFSGGG